MTQRRILGIAAVLLLFCAWLLWLWQPASEHQQEYVSPGVLAFCWRMGAILAAAWLAYDDVQRIPTWLLMIAPLLLIVLARSPKIFLIVLPALVLCAFLARFLLPPRGKIR